VPRPISASTSARLPAFTGDDVLALALLGAGLVLGIGGTALKVLSATGWGLLLTLVTGALLSGGVVLGGLALRGRLLRREAMRDQWQRELRYLAAWASEEGILRKAGLIRDLSALQTERLSLAQVLLPGADLRGCYLVGADLRGANLRRADLQGAVLDAADLTNADLSEANLGMASLKAAKLRGCALEGANLAKAELEGASLVRAQLVNANVHGIDFKRVLLDRTRFALSEASDFGAQLHPTVEDWIRERLDGRGYYMLGGAELAEGGEAGLDEEMLG
jgi:uncharacterized protein YjbI with pentapeptide repeats